MHTPDYVTHVISCMYDTCCTCQTSFFAHDSNGCCIILHGVRSDMAHGLPSLFPAWPIWFSTTWRMDQVEAAIQFFPHYFQSLWRTWTASSQCFVVLHGGPGGQCIHFTTSDRKKYNAVMGKLDDYFKVHWNVILERARFNWHNQLPGETIEQYIPIRQSYTT